MASADKRGQEKPPLRPAAHLASLQASIRRGLADAAGRTRPAAEVFERLERKYLGMAGPEK
jgi:hypothetical protein